MNSSSSNGPFEHVVIVGLGETKVGKLEGHGPVQIQAMAALDAVHSAGLTLGEIDGIINQDPYSIPYSMFSLALTEYLGLKPTFTTSVNVGGSVTVMEMVSRAAAAVASGQCRYCLVVQGENMATSRPPGSQGHVLHTRQGGDEFKEPFGVQGALVPYALMANRYRHEFGVSEDDFGAVAVHARRQAALNPNRQTRTQISIEDYRASPLISDPLRRLDCSLVSDGGAALLLTSRQEARRRGLKGVAIDAYAMQATHCSIVDAPDFSELGAASVAARVYEQAGLGLDAIDLAFVHDAFTFTVLVQLEAMGVAKPGETGHMIREGYMDTGGRLPVNTHGGLLAQAHFGGALHGVEAVRQLRGEAGGRQVEDARRAIWFGNGGIFSVFGAMVLSRYG